MMVGSFPVNAAARAILRLCIADVVLREIPEASAASFVEIVIYSAVSSVGGYGARLSLEQTRQAARGLNGDRRVGERRVVVATRGRPVGVTLILAMPIRVRPELRLNRRIQGMTFRASVHQKVRCPSIELGGLDQFVLERVGALAFGLPVASRLNPAVVVLTVWIGLQRKAPINQRFLGEFAIERE